MKEYIEKQELLELLEDNAIYNADNISCLKTYTQADLEQDAYERGYKDGQDKGSSDTQYVTARAFAENLKDRIPLGCADAKFVIDELLKEMGVL